MPSEGRGRTAGGFDSSEEEEPGPTKSLGRLREGFTDIEVLGKEGCLRKGWEGEWLETARFPLWRKHYKSAWKKRVQGG